MNSQEVPKDEFIEFKGFGEPSRGAKVAEAFKTAGKVLGRGLAGVVGGVLALVGGAASLTMTAVNLLLKAVAVPLGAAAGGLVGAFVGLLRGQPFEGMMKGAATGVKILDGLTKAATFIPSILSNLIMDCGFGFLKVAAGEEHLKELGNFSKKLGDALRKTWEVADEVPKKIEEFGKRTAEKWNTEIKKTHEYLNEITIERDYSEEE